MEYKIDKTLIKPITRANLDSEDYMEWFLNPDICKYTSHMQNIYTDLKKETFWDDIQCGRRLVWAIYSINKNVEYDYNFLSYKNHSKYYIGNVSLQEIDSINRSCELAIIIGEKEYQGKGYAFNACKLLLNYAFRTLNMHRVWLGTLNLNLPMKKLAGKLKMKYEGSKRDSFFYNGKYHYIDNYSILRYEYEVDKLKGE